MPGTGWQKALPSAEPAVRPAHAAGPLRPHPRAVLRGSAGGLGQRGEGAGREPARRTQTWGPQGHTATLAHVGMTLRGPATGSGGPRGEFGFLSVRPEWFSNVVAPAVHAPSVTNPGRHPRAPLLALLPRRGRFCFHFSPAESGFPSTRGGGDTGAGGASGRIGGGLHCHLLRSGTFQNLVVGSTRNRKRRGWKVFRCLLGT